MSGPNDDVTDAELIAALVRLNQQQLAILIAFAVLSSLGPRRAFLRRVLQAIGANL